MRPDRRVRASWRQTTIHELVEARPIGRPAGGNGRSPAFRVLVAGGARLELGADAVCERLVNEHGERVVLTVDRAAHVLAVHMRGTRTGVFLSGMTLTRLLGLVRRRCHEPLGHGERADRITVSCAGVIGTSGVASARELVERGVLTDADLRRLAHAKEEVLAANLHGSGRDRAALVARLNHRWRGSNVRLTLRNGVALPAFIAAAPPTRSFVIVLDRPRAGAPALDERRIRTIYPGRSLCDAPADPSQMVGEHDRARLRAYRNALEVWYEHAPLLPAGLRVRR